MNVSDITLVCGDHELVSSSVLDLCVHLDGEAFQRLADDYGIVWDGGKRVRGPVSHRVRFIPSSRAMIFADGWPPPARMLAHGFHMCDRAFAEHVNSVIKNARGDLILFKSIYDELRKSIESVLGMRVVVDYDGAIQARRLFGVCDGECLPYVAWNHEMRALFPLVLGVADLLTDCIAGKAQSIEYVVFEFPEIGLSSKGLNLFVQIVFELVANGHKVVIATGSVDILYAMWMLENLQHTGQAADILEAVEWPKTSRCLDVAKKVLASDISVNFFGDRSCSSVEECIDALTEQSSKFARIVARCVNEGDAK